MANRNSYSRAPIPLKYPSDIPTPAIGCFNRVTVDGVACIDFYVTTNVFTHGAELDLDGARLGPRPPFSTYSLCLLI
jgi:hypothetical protein